MHVAFVMDPFAELDSIDEDTSCSLVEECLRRGHRVLYARVEWLRLADGLSVCSGQRVLGREGMGFMLSATEEVHLDEVDAVFMRKDPPVDLWYCHALHILSRIGRSTVVVNSAEGIRRVNEKLYPLSFPHLTPRSIVTCSPGNLLRFLEDVGGQMVVKPLHECSGRGLLYLRLGDLSTRSVLDMATAYGRRFVMAQEFLPEVMDRGDKRILMLAGLPLGVMSRIPAPGEYRANIHQGGRFAPAVLDSTDMAICAALGPRLVADGIYLAGIDVVGGKVLEVNVTSPAGIPEINELTGSHLEEAVMDWLEQEIRARRGE